jgi:hypothetical protein
MTVGQETVRHMSPTRMSWTPTPTKLLVLKAVSQLLMPVEEEQMKGLSDSSLRAAVAVPEAERV